MINRHIMRKNNGFGLIELLVVIGVMVVISAIATPSVLSWRANAKLSGAAQELRAAVQLARSRAIQEGKTVIVDLADERCFVFVDRGDGSGGPPDWVHNPQEPIVLQRQLPAGIRIERNVTATGAPAPVPPVPVVGAPISAIHDVCSDILRNSVEAGNFAVAGSLLTIDGFDPAKAQFILTGSAPRNWRVWYDGVAVNKIFIINEVYPDELIFDSNGRCLNPQFMILVNIKGQKMLLEVTRFGIAKVTKMG